MTRRLATYAAALSLTSLLAVSANAGVDVEVDAAAKIQSSLTDGEVETYRFTATAGSVLSLTVAAAKKATIDFGVSLFDPTDDAVDLTAAPKYADQDKKIVVKKLVLTETGEYRLVITGNGFGDFKVSLKATPQKIWKVTLNPLPGSGSDQVAFAAPAGALVTFKAKSARGSAAEPRFGLYGTTDLTDAGKSKATAHTVKKQSAGAGGDQTVTVANRAATDGDVGVTIVVAAPKGKPEKVDARAFVLGDEENGGTLFARTVDDQSGGVVTVSDAGSVIDGAGVDVPAGSLGAPTRISVASSTPLAPPDPEGEQAAGPAVEFGPDGLTFAIAASVTIPYDPALLPFGADPLTDLEVLRVQSDGTTTVISPTSVDTLNDTVTFPTTGFSRFMTFVPRGPPNLEGRSYWGMVVELEFQPDQGQDSRSRGIFLGINRLSFGKQGVLDDVIIDEEQREVRIDNPTTGSPGLEQILGTVTPQNSSSGGTATWTYEPDGRHVQVVDSGGEMGRLAVSENGSVLIGGLEPGPFPVVFLDLLLEKPAKPISASAAAGTYHFGEFAAGADAFGGGPVSLAFSHAFGSMTLRADGTIAGRVDGKDVFGDPGGKRTDKFSESISGTWRVAGPEEGAFEGAVILTVDDEEGSEEFRFLPSRNRQVMVGTDHAPIGDEALVIVAVRQSSGLKARDLAGDYSSFILEAELTSYTAPPPARPDQVSDWRVFNLSESRHFDGVRDLSFADFDEISINRDPTAPDGLQIQRFQGVGGDESDRYTLAANGKVTTVSTGEDNDRFVGAVTKDTQFGFTLDDPQGPLFVFGFDLFVKAPAGGAQQ